MIKCRYIECQYPDCGKTCGMTDDLSLLVAHLQERIKNMKNTQKALSTDIYNMRYTLTRLLDNVTKSFTKEEYIACAQTCLHGYPDCVHNPEYLRRYYPNYWEEIGMPTECIESECYYDDEDK